MPHLDRYLRTHLAGSTAGVDLFDHAARKMPEPFAVQIRAIQRELVEERAQLRAMMQALGVTGNPVFNALARAGERVGRLKPNGDLLHRTAMTDLAELETMCVALAGKQAGWESLLAIADQEPRLQRVELERLLAQAKDQQRTVRRMHAEAAAKALARPGTAPHRAGA